MKRNYFKYIFTIVGIILTSFALTTNVSAASSTISISSSKSTVVVGSSVTVTVNVSSASSLGAWEFSLNYDTYKLRLTSTTNLPRIVDYASSSNKKSASYSYTFTALKSGTATFSIASASVIGWDEAAMSVNKGTKTISIITQAQLEATYSKNNYLSSLSVDGAALTPEFNKDTLEYSVELEPETTNINVNATKEDNKASISGVGNVNVSEGDNKIEIKVTAENGNVRTYIINAKVRELSPINVTINGENYTVVRKKEVLQAPTGYIEQSTMIQNEEVPSFKNETTGFTLVGLKNSAGEVGLYIYNEANESYKLYNEFTFNRLVLYLEGLDIEIPSGYKKTTITINDKEITSYKLYSTSRFALIYGMNVETGEKNLYMYDNKENTLQRYNGEMADKLNETIDQYLLIIYILSGISSLFVVIFIVIIVKKLVKLRKNKKNKIDNFESLI